ncbi:hypothetical protein, partial [Plasmodium yoelii yoelii]
KYSLLSNFIIHFAYFSTEISTFIFFLLNMHKKQLYFAMYDRDVEGHFVTEGGNHNNYFLPIPSLLNFSY